ncbi:MAG TPA: glycosyltransferase family 4 protein [Gammaproteobacteria bacterium]|nr:glycosyltransferase family 4 protein [Gammaproteobacteria bacterium]
MRVLFCNYEYPPLGGGGGVVNAALAEALAKRHEVTVLTSRALGLPAEDVANGVRVVRVPVFFRRRYAAANFSSMFAYLVTGTWGGRRLVRMAGFDVVNTHFALPSGPVGHKVAHAAGIPNVLSVHGGDLFDPSKRSSAHRHAPLRAAVRFLALNADAVVAQSRDTAANLHRYYAAEVEPAVIPLGIARPPAVAGRREEYGFAPDDVLLVTVGRMVKRKAVEQLIEVLAGWRDERVKLLLLGSGPLSDGLERLAFRLGVRGRVHFMGRVTERAKFELLSSADVYVSTSQHEGFGLVFLEAMACGLPVVAYDRGGQADFLEDGVTGHVVRLNDRDAFRARCESLIASPERRAAIAAANRKRAEHFFIDRCAERYEALFASVIEAHAAGRSRAAAVAAPSGEA